MYMKGKSLNLKEQQNLPNLKNRQKKDGKKWSLRDLWDNIKRSSILVIGVPELEEEGVGEEKEVWRESGRRLPRFGDINLQIQKAL